MTLLPQEIIRRKRDGSELDAEQIASFHRGPDLGPCLGRAGGVVRHGGVFPRLVRA